MATTVKEVIQSLDQLAPPKLAEDWDRTGLHLGNENASVTGVLVALDPLLAAIEMAAEKGLNLVVTHHPLFFKPLDRIDSHASLGKLLKVALAKGINVFSAHTNLDSAQGGINDLLSASFQLTRVEPLSPSLAGNSGGMGRVGRLPKEMSFSSFAKWVKQVLKTGQLRMVGQQDKMVRKIALCGGSGASLIPMALMKQVDCYVTADLKYHDALDALENDFLLVDPGHFAMEQIMIPHMVDYLGQKAKELNWNFPIQSFGEASDPFKWVA